MSGLIDDKAVAARVRQLRLALKVGNQAAMAARLDIPFNRYNNVESGYPLSKDMAARIVRAFPGVTLDWLYLGNAGLLPLDLAKSLGEAPSAITGPSSDDPRGKTTNSARRSPRSTKR